MAIPIFCGRFRDCKNPKPELINDTADAWVFQCKACHRIQVVTKDHVKEKVRYEREVQRYKPKHSWDRPRMTFDFGKGTR